jgi:hypothetical protein
MMGFPKTIGCKQDLVNLEKEFPKETKAVLEQIETYDKANATVIKVVSGSEDAKNLVIATIANPGLISKRLGYKDVAEVSAKLTAIAKEDPIEEPSEEVIEDGK